MCKFPMPVLGHAVVGFATALYTQAALPPPPDARRQRAGATFWTPALVGMAFLPDIVAQVLHAAGVGAASRLTHSVGFAIACAVPAGLLIMRLRRVPFLSATAIALASIALHVALDLLQGTDRAVLWPFSSRRLNLGVSVVPTSLLGEALLFGAIFAAGMTVPAMRARFRPTRAALLPSIAVALVLAVALATHVMRDLRESQLRAAQRLIEQRQDFRQGLAMLERAESWPSPAKPGRIDYLRGEAYERLGARDTAEHWYLRSYAADPSYFWVVSDLALFYASGPEPASVRRQAVAPYVRQLTGQFRRRRETPRVLDSIERRLRGQKTDAASPAP